MGTTSKDAKGVELKCGSAGTSLNNEPGELEVEKAMVGGGNSVLPSKYNEPL